MDKRLALFSGLVGALMAGIGIYAVARERKMLSTVNGLGRGLGRRAAQAPIVGTYSDGNMKTTLRQSNNMPIEQRVATIQQLVERSIQDPHMRRVALQITSQCPERDGLCEARAVYDAVKSRVRYTGDIAPVRWSSGVTEGVDLFQSARRTWEDMRGGDCDDQAILISTLLALNGITPRLRVVRARGDKDWSHIFVVGLLPKGVDNKAVALDTTLPGYNFGVEPSYHKKLDFDA
jgi:transglutaminase-like putative cysteine protease